MRSQRDEIEALSAFFQGRAELIQIEPRSPQASARVRLHDTHRILRFEPRSAIVLRADLRRGQSCVVQSVSASAPARVLGIDVLAGQPLLAAGGEKLDLYVPRDGALRILVVESASSPGRGLHSSDAIAVTPRVKAVMSACRFIDERFPGSIAMRDLARLCGVAERTLEYGFMQLYGTTPLAFFRSQRLSRSRKALLEGAAGALVGQAARGSGFRHMGQYSKDYRRLFGETPSETLARSIRRKRLTPSNEPIGTNDYADEARGA